MLTDTQCRNAKLRAKPYRLSDGKGLCLEVKPSGAKVWRYRYESVRVGARKENLFALGEYVYAPAGETVEEAKARRDGSGFTLAEAREERAKARALVKQGINPAHQRQLERIRRSQASATTFEAVAREWLALRDWQQSTKDRRLDMLTRIVFTKIGPLPIKQVTSAHVLDVITLAAKNNGASVAAEAKRTMSAVFNHAVSTLRADADPVYPVRNALPPNKTQHKRPLLVDEVGQLLRDLAAYERNFQTAAAFQLMWLTLCRPNEVIGARWDEIDVESGIWRIPPERMKRRKEHIVPLPRQAISLLRAMQGFTGHLRHVFPNRDDRTKPMTDATMRQALKYLGWSGRYSPHATRTTGSTRLNELGYPADWIERQLAHAEPNAVRRTYNHADYLNDRTKMMQQWADMLDSWRNGPSIVLLKSVAAA